METKAIQLLDEVINKITIPFSTMEDNKVILKFMRIFSHKDDDLIAHYFDKFICSSKKDWGNYFFSCGIDMIRSFFEHFDINMEPDKYEDEIDLIRAQMSNKSKFEIYPYEFEILRRFYLIANNNSLQLLEKLTPEAFQRVKSNKINLYGNGINWSLAWLILSEDEKNILVTHFLDDNNL